MGVCTSNQNKTPEDSEYRKVAKLSLHRNRSIGHEIGIAVTGYIRQIIKQFQFNRNTLTLPSDIRKLCTLYFGPMSNFTDLIIQSGATLRLNNVNQRYNSILIKKNGTLTVNRYNDKTQNGGLLHIVSYGNITLEEGASINLNGKGYHGGNHGRNGASYHSKSKCVKSRLNNYSGGGAGQISLNGEYGAMSSNGAGAGYGSIGSDGKYNEDSNYGIGGAVYGDKELSTLHRGSGGGGGYRLKPLDNSLRAEKGGSGGGALELKCFGSILMKNGAKICCDGNKGKGEVAGCGSGGSIHIIIQNKDNLQMEENGCISAIGGINKSNSGSGGDGRVRIQFLTKSTHSHYYHDITPKPYVG